MHMCLYMPCMWRLAWERKRGPGEGRVEEGGRERESPEREREGERETLG